MSRKRRILILTEAQLAVIQQALRFVDDSYDVGQGDGDVSDQWARANERVRALVGRAPIHNVKAAHDALRDVVGAAIDNSCSCVGLDVTGEYRGMPEHKPSGHARDCWVATNHRNLERVRALFTMLEVT